MKIPIVLVFFISFFFLGLSRPKLKNFDPCPGVKRSRKGYVLDIVEEGWLCCMCNSGTFMQEPCKKNIPTSTVCTRCPFSRKNPNKQFYQRKGPHHHRTCLKSVSSCKPGFQRIRGTRKRAAGCERKFSALQHKF